MSKLLADVSANERPCNSGSRSMRNAREFVDLQTSREGNTKKSSGNWRSKFKNVSGGNRHNHPFHADGAIGRTRFDSENPITGAFILLRGVCLALEGRR